MKKVLSSIMALLLCVGIAGCGNNSENEKPKEEPTNEVNKDQYEIKTEEMSEEETRALVEGQHIEKIDDRTLKVPNRAILEEMGLDYEIVMSSIITYENGEEKDLGANDALYMYHLKDVNLEPYDTIDNDNNRITVSDYIIGINIIPIINAYIDKANGNINKSVQMMDYVYNSKMINPDNLEKLQQMIYQKYS